MLFTSNGQPLSSIKEEWRLATTNVDTPRDLCEPTHWEEWKRYASALPLEKQIAKLEETLAEAHDLWKKGPISGMKQDDKLSLYSAFSASSFLIHRLHIRLDFSSPDDQLYGTDRAAYDKIIGPRDDRMLYHVQNTLKALGVDGEKMAKFGAAREQYRDLVKDPDFMAMQTEFSRIHIETTNARLHEERQQRSQQPRV